MKIVILMLFKMMTIIMWILKVSNTYTWCEIMYKINSKPWWRHQMETFSVVLALCAGNSPVTGEFPHKGQWHGALMFPLIGAWTNIREAGDLRRHRAHYDVTVMFQPHSNIGAWHGGHYLAKHLSSPCKTYEHNFSDTTVVQTCGLDAEADSKYHMAVWSGDCEIVMVYWS